MTAERKPASELEELARLHGRIAVHATALAGLEREVAGRIERTDLFAVLVADTAIAENYTHPRQCLAWLTASHRSWLRANTGFNAGAERLAFYRYVLLPYPSLLRSLPRRQFLIDAILLHLHLQLWHGIVCGVLFLDPRTTELAEVIRDLNFVAIPSQRVFIDNPDFYRGENLQSAVTVERDADRRLREVQRLLYADGRRRPIWLHYDERNFGGERLAGWRWEALRVLFRNLYGPNLRCSVPLCGKLIGKFDLDHIAPVSQRHYQTVINFRPLCSQCNKEKADMVYEDPFQLRMMLPEDLRTRELDDIHRLAPPWLGNLRPPESAKEIQRRLSVDG